MKVSVVIPNYNGAHLIEKNLPTVVEALKFLEKETSIEWEITVVDDFSSDNSQKVLESLRKTLGRNFKYLTNEKNYGFSTSVNKGAHGSDGDFLLLLNSDVSVENNFIEPLIKNFNEDHVFAVGCRDESVEGDNIVSRGRGKGDWKRGFLVHSAAPIKKGPTLWVSGGSGMFRKDLWDKLGGFNENYNPFYWEDIDLSYRAQKSGYKTLFEPKSVVLHKHEEGAIRSKYSSKEIKKIAYRNQIIFVWQNADFENIVKNIIWLPYHIFKTIIEGDLIFTQSLIASVLLLPKVVKSRMKFNKFFVKTDMEVVSNAQ